MMLIAGKGSRSRRWLPLAATALAVVAACGPAHAPAGAAPAFPSTAAGMQARWFFHAVGSPPIPDADIRAHFSAAELERFPPAAINARLAGAAQARLVSVAGTRSHTVVFVVSFRRAQRFRVTVTVDPQGLIADLGTQEVMSTAAPSSMIPSLPSEWVAEPVIFAAQGVTIHGTYTHPRAATAGGLPAALLLGGLGYSTDRDDNSPGQPHRNTLAAVASWLAADGVVSLRYDKLGSGQTGWAGYAPNQAQVGIEPYEQESVAALSFLATQRSVDPARLAVFGHSEGALYALLAAGGGAGPAPPVRAIVLLEPVSVRLLDLFAQSSAASLTTAVQNGEVTAAQARSLEQAFSGAIDSLRSTGTLPSGLPDAVAATFTGENTLAELTQIDRHDPAVLTGQLPKRSALLLTCSNADDKFGCDQVDRLAASASRASVKLDYVHLDGIDHFLKEDISRNPADYDEALPFSAQLRAALARFMSSSL